MMTWKKSLGLVGVTCLLIYTLSWIPWLIVRSQATIITDTKQLPKADVAIVFGGLHREGQPLSETNTERLLTAKFLLDNGIVKSIKISNTTAAVHAMNDLLMRSGVDALNIELDDTATVTEDTCISEKRSHPQSRIVIFISHAYHIPRLQYLCQKIGLSGIGFPAETLKVISRSELPFWQKGKIRYQRYQQESVLVLMKMAGFYTSTVK